MCGVLSVCGLARKKPSVCRFKTSPCVGSKRLRVYRQHAHMFQHMCAWCRHTRGRFECTHGGVFEATNGVEGGGGSLLSLSLSIPLSLSFSRPLLSFSFLSFGRGKKGPRAGSRQRQHSTAVRITVTMYPTMTKLNGDQEKGDTSSWPSVKLDEANCHKAMDKRN